MITFAPLQFRRLDAKSACQKKRPSKRLETFPNPTPQRDYRIHMEIPEFTCLCPMTGPAGLRHAGARLRPRPQVRRAEVAQAVRLVLPRRGRVPRGGDQPDPRRPGARHRSRASCGWRRASTCAAASTPRSSPSTASAAGPAKFEPAARAAAAVPVREAARPARRHGAQSGAAADQPVDRRAEAPDAGAGQGRAGRRTWTASPPTRPPPACRRCARRSPAGSAAATASPPPTPRPRCCR